MVRNNIPFSMVNKRSIHQQPSSIKESSIPYSSIINNLNNTELVNEFFKENCSNNYLADLNASKVLKILENDIIKNSSRYNYYVECVINDIIPSCKNLEGLKENLQFLNLDKDIKEAINSCIEKNMICSRVLDNNEKICSRFNMENIIRNCKFKEVSDIVESVCEKIDTYNMPIKKKLNVALEETLYLYNRSGNDIDISNVVESTIDYFLRENSLLTDKDMNGIRNVLDTNPFITNENTLPVSYLYTEAILFSQKYDILTEAAKNKEAKSLIQKCKEAKTLSVAKAVINDIFKFIRNIFIIGIVISLAEVLLVISAMFSMILNITSAASSIILHISGKTDELKKIDKEKLSKEQIEELEKIIDQLQKNLEEAKKDSVKEAANIMDQALDKDMFNPSIFAIHEPEPEFAFSMINDFNKKSVKDVVKESKDYAESDDVKDLINKYKADQNKTKGKLKATIERIFTKSPAQIIDETPKILEFVRVFAILSTSVIPIIGPALSLVTLVADRYTTMTLKRKDADKVCNYFNAEKEKMEKKYNSMSDGDKKDDLGEYISCLEKCIDKLEDYRDSLYSEKELDRRNGYDEAAMVDFSEKITMNDYMCSAHKTVCHYIDIAIQSIKNEVMRKCSGVYIEEYELANGELASNVFMNMPPQSIMKNFMNPDGIINIPLFMIKESVLGTISNKNLYMTITEICSYVNQYLGNKCMVNNYNENGNIYIVFNYLQSIIIDDEIEPYCATEELKEYVTNISFFESAVDEIEKHNPSTIVQELCKNIDSIVYEYDIDELIDILEDSNLIYEEFINSLKDYDAICTNMCIKDNIKRALDTLEYDKLYKSDYSINESLFLQTESLALLEGIIMNAKKVKEGKEPKGSIIKNAKDKLADTKQKAKTNAGIAKSKASVIKDKFGNTLSKGEVRVKKAANTAALSAEVIKKKAKQAGTKEKEVSRNIDISLSQLKKSVDNALTSNRREAIVKGSIIPSFSKLIKFGIGAGILFKINPGLAAIASIGALIRSRSLNKKERYLLMDEISTELKVVEKELEIADRDGDMKKYRNLLTFQKKLQREMQRLKYDMKIHPKPAALDSED